MHELAMTSSTAFLLLLANLHLISSVPIAHSRNKDNEVGYKMQPVVTPRAVFYSSASPALLEVSLHRLLSS
jgi:hypothetical protein